MLMAKAGDQGNNPAGIVRAGELAEIDITDISQEGQGVGRLRGMTVFVPSSIPYDRVLIRVETVKNRYALASLQGLVKPSPDRVVPPCAASVECGGCTLQSMAYSAQLALKQRQVREALSRIGKAQDPGSLIRPIIGMDDPWQYRSKVQFPVAGRADKPEIGFYAARSHQVIHTPFCPIQPPICDTIRDIIAGHMRQWAIEPYKEDSHSGLLRHIIVRIGFFTGEVMVGLIVNGDEFPGSKILCENLRAAIAIAKDPKLPPLQLACVYINKNSAQTNVIQSGECRILFGRPWIEEKILGLRYRISPLSFFQVNPRQTNKLYSVVLQLAELQGTETVFDLYCGTGSITLQLAQKAKTVIGIETVPEAIADARINAAINGIENAEFTVGKAEVLVPKLIAEGLQADLVVLDPPRKGCDNVLNNTLIESGIRRIVYISCNPATLARDVASYLDGGYKLQAVQPVDMFPWTGHVETVVLMSRTEAGKA